jgi:hypothetical protein
MGLPDQERIIPADSLRAVASAWTLPKVGFLRPTNRLFAIRPGSRSDSSHRYKLSWQIVMPGLIDTGISPTLLTSRVDSL